MMKKCLIISVFTLLSCLTSFAEVKDSTGVKKAKDGTMIVLHKVEAGQTLWRLYVRYKKYGATVDKIKKSNNNSTVLKTGAIVEVPTTTKYGSIAAKSKKKKHTRKGANRAANRGANRATKIVRKGTDNTDNNTEDVVSENTKKHNRGAANRGANKAVNKNTRKANKKTPRTSSSTIKTPEIAKRTNKNKVHVVQGGETLYAISKQYEVSVDNIKKWNSLSSIDLNEGQKLIVGKKSTHKSVPSVGKTVTHKVEKGETLYAISKKYGVSVNQLKSLNPNVGNGISVGAHLVIKQGTSTVDADGTVHEDITATNENHNKIYTGYEKIVQEGTASLTNRRDFDDQFSYVFHKTIPYGVIVTITNLETGEYTYARVIGKSSSTHLIQVSSAVWNTLKLSGSAPKVKIAYVL